MSFGTGTVVGGRWLLETRIATGGMGEVHLARDRRGGTPVAVKLLRDGITDGDRRFASEAATLRRLEHPNIVRLLDAGDHDGVPFLVMALVEGPSLAARIRQGCLPVDAVVRVAVGLADALAYAHERGIVHRDVKPSNVILTADGTPLLADFGIARVVGSTEVTATGLAIGTASYVAPEQLTDRRGVGPRSDVYSLGLVLLEALTGRRAFTGSPTEAALARLAREPEVPWGLPSTWQHLLRRMTARDPADRPTSREVAEVARTDLLRVGTAPWAVAPATDRSSPGRSVTALDEPTQPNPMPPTTGGVTALTDARTTTATAAWRRPRMLLALSALVGLAVLGVSLVALPDRDAAPTADAPRDPRPGEGPQDRRGDKSATPAEEPSDRPENDAEAAVGDAPDSSADGGAPDGSADQASEGPGANSWDAPARGRGADEGAGAGAGPDGDGPPGQRGGGPPGHARTEQGGGPPGHARTEQGGGPPGHARAERGA